MKKESTAEATGLNPEIVNKFIINTVLIDPISEIIKKLENNEFRDCDIKWLDAKLAKFFNFAVETLNIKGIMPNQIESEPFTHFNEYVTNRYLGYFNTLLNYFKSF